MSTPLINYIYIWRRGIYPQAGKIKFIVTLHSSICTCENAFCVRNSSSSSAADTARTLARDRSDKQDNQLVLTNTVLHRAVLHTLHKIRCSAGNTRNCHYIWSKNQSKQKSHPTSKHFHNSIFQVINNLPICFDKKNTNLQFVTASQCLPWI